MQKAKKNLFVFTFMLLVLLTAMFVLTVPSFANTVMQPYVNGVTTNSVWVVVECTTTTAAVVDYGTTTSYGSTATASGNQATTVASSYVHNIKLTGLSANTTYHYRVRQGTSTSADYTFTTAVNPGTAFRFSFYADTRTNAAPHDAVAAKIKAANPKFVLFGGDLANSATYSTLKGEFFRTNELNLISNTPFFFTPGNHEGWTQNSKAFFQAPSSTGTTDPDYYSFDYGDMHVVSINTEVDLTVGSPQYNWIASDLAASTKAWKIAFFHKPGYNSGASHGENAAIKTLSANVLVPNGVVMTLAGDSHYYQHNRVSGIDHMIVGSAGAPLYDPIGASYTVMSQKTTCYSIIDVTPTTFTFNAYTDTGALIENITYTKGGPTPTPTPTPTPGAQGVLSDCDSIGSWTGTDTVTLDTTNKKEGTGSLTKTGIGGTWFRNPLTTPINSGVAESTGYLHLWLYISDASKTTGGQIEISSSGTFDVDEYAWSMSGISLVNGWNELNLKISNASKAGTPNLSAINYFRLYSTLSASVTCKIDDVYFYTSGGATPTPAPTPDAQVVLDNCNSTTGWTGTDAISLNTTDKKEGTASLSKTGTGTDWFKKVFTTPVDSGVTEANGYLHVWLYVSDATKLGASGQLEITSSGVADSNEYGWSLASLNLVTGWNELNLKISSATKTGTPDLSAINYFRAYYFLTASVTCKIDNIYFYTSGGGTPTPTPAPSTPPSDAIKNIHLSWNENSTTSTATVTWTTTTNTASIVKYGTTSSYGYQVTGTTTNSSALGVYVHTAKITGLSSNTTYHYSCGATTDGYSADYTFKTAPAKGSTTAFTIGVWSDTQNDTGDNSAFAITDTVASKMRTFNPRFTIHAGDVVASSSSTSSWLSFLDKTQDLNATAPLMPILGNHDVPSNTTVTANFTDAFNLPNNEQYYSFDYGNTHFVFLNTGKANDVAEDQTIFYPGTAQYNWLKTDLQNASSDAAIKWIVVNMHYPSYSYGVSQSIAAQNHLSPLFDQYGVDLVIAGHRHVYERMKSINNKTVVQSGPNYTATPAGTVYLIAGSAGGNSMGGGSTTYTAYSNATPYAFGILDVSSTSLSYRAMHEDGSVFDTWSITK